MIYNTETGVLEGAISLPLCTRTVNCDVNEDISVPEEFPEVRRFLAIRENILAPAKFIGARSVDFSGAVDYTLIYLGADGKINSMPFSAEYSFSLPIENADKVELGEGVSALCALSGDGASVRVNTPRRLQLRAGIRASVLCFGRGLCEENLRGVEDPSALQRMRLDSKCLAINCESSDVVTLADDYFIGEDCRILYSDASCVINDSAVDGEVVRVSGEVCVRLTIERGDSVEQALRKIPFEAQTDIEELDGGEVALLCSATGSINELNVAITAGRAEIEVALVLSVCIARNSDICYTRDIYSTAQICNAEYKKMRLPYVIANKNATLTQSERVTCESIGLDGGFEIVDVWGNAACESCLLENGRYVLRGNIKYKLLCKRESEIRAYDAELPFKYESGSGELDISSFCAHASIIGARARSDGENVMLESEIALMVAFFGENELEMLSSADFGEAVRLEKNQMVVCFKSSDEEIFEIGKRYCVPLEDISSDDSGSRFVIIER